MTCDECQAIIIDIARGAEVDRALRDEARRHAALCPRCGEQQQEQQWLTGQLRALASAEASHDAPERVEIAVLAAWRAAQQGPATTPGAVATATAMTPRAEAGTRKAWLLPSVALAGLAAAAMAMMFVWPSTVATPRGGNIATNMGTRAALDSNKQGREVGAQAPAEADEAEDEASATPARNATQPPAGMTPSRARVEAVLARATTETEFLPLPYVEPLRSTEARHIVRVSMTSGDEMILGMLPADRRSGQPFEADVLVGEDGIARAIRVVQ
jgi:hypothetical protein